jgi:hypothetical protein
MTSMISDFLARFGCGRASRGVLSVATSETSHGNLRMEIAYACADQDEAVMLEIIVRKPKRIFAVCESLRGWTTDGHLGWRSLAQADRDRARRVRTPMSLDSVSGHARTTAYLADFGEGYRYRVSSGEVIFRIVGATSGRRLLSRRMTIEPAPRASQ